MIPKEAMNAIQKGYYSVAEVLEREYGSQAPSHTASIERFIPLAKELIDTWGWATNPVGKAGTIYDEYHRLVSVARLVLKEYDESAFLSRDSMEALRATLISLGVDTK